VTDVHRLTLVSHALTAAMAAGRFPGDEPLSDVGRRQAEAAAHRHAGGEVRHLTAPEQRARETSELLGLHAYTDARLADLDCRGWRGQPLAGIGPAELQLWLTDPAAVPHGGESIVELTERVAGWLKSLSYETKSDNNKTDNATRTIAVTHPAVIRAAILVALDAPPKSFWRIDIAPVSHTVLHYRGQTWTLRR
jgi:broad specificity phosphatase PhoE